MGRAFEDHDELETEASPEQVWHTIATGPGQDSWFLGRNQLGVGVGGEVTSDFAGGAIPSSVFTAWEPGHRLAFRSPTGDDGRFLATEYLIEGRDSGGAVLRIVTSGFLPGDDWESEYDAMRSGNCIFRSSLAQAAERFPSRTAFPTTVFSPPVADWVVGWKRVDEALGLAGPPARGMAVHLDVPGLPPIDGELYVANEQVRGVRTADALYRFIQGLPGFLVLAHVRFDGGALDGPEPEGPWQAWLERVLS